MVSIDNIVDISIKFNKNSRQFSNVNLTHFMRVSIIEDAMFMLINIFFNEIFTPETVINSILRFIIQSLKGKI